MGRTGFFEQSDKAFQTGRAEMAQLASATRLHCQLHFFQQRRSGRRDPHLDDAAVVGPSLAMDQPPPFEAIEQPGDVGGPRNQPGTDRERGERRRSRFVEQAQGVVLLGRQFNLGKDLLFNRFEAVERAPEIQVGLLLERIEFLPAGLLPGTGGRC